MDELIIKDAQETCKQALLMPTTSKEQIDQMWEYVFDRENKICRSAADHELWRTAFVFFEKK